MARKTIEQIEAERDEYHVIVKDMLEMVCAHCSLSIIEAITREVNNRRDQRIKSGTPEVQV